MTPKAHAPSHAPSATGGGLVWRFGAHTIVLDDPATSQAYAATDGPDWFLFDADRAELGTSDFISGFSPAEDRIVLLGAEPGIGYVLFEVRQHGIPGTWLAYHGAEAVDSHLLLGTYGVTDANVLVA